MKIKTIAVLLLLILFSKSFAQKLELEKISISELEEKKHPIDTSAVAAILFNKARTFFGYDLKNGFSINTEYIFRIKIYKTEGLKWADYKVPYYVGYENYNDDRVDFSNCVTYNLENGVIVKTKLKSEGDLNKKVNKYWNEASITMPNVKVGSVIEFKYILKSENIVKFPNFDFQYEIPVNHSQYRTEIPLFFIYKAIVTGLFPVKSEAKIVTGSLSYADKYDITRSKSVSFRQINSNYSAENIPALVEEPYVDNIQNYRSTIQHELEKTQFYEEPVKDYSKTWEGVAKTIYEDKSFGKELNERLYIEQDLKTILKNVTSELERIDVIFKFVQNKMNWNNQKGYYTDKGVKKAYLEGIGNTAEINFILISMLNNAGINANPVLLSTIENGIPFYPSRTVFNYVIAAVEVDGKQILLDATNKNTVQNVLPLYALNWAGRLIRPDGSSQEINLVTDLSSNNTINMKVEIGSNGKITGKSRIQRTDYEAFTFRVKNRGINQENYLEKLENDLNEIKISDYTIENAANLSKPIIENFTFISDNECEIIGGKMYINPLLFFTHTKNPFVLGKRQFPIYFGYPKQEKFNLSFQIPEGYAVESIPKSIKIATGENVGVYVFNILAEGNTIQIQVVKNINKAVVSENFYDVLKAFYQQMIDKQNEKIVLKKI
ncbi:DUF3857 domain-containing protein [Flavobacterium sp.]|uniref:DUF3857 domain-containing protein n=1 Tax=Flavobacterium sp. TaxID=239 RepID=UPI00379E654A